MQKDTPDILSKAREEGLAKPSAGMTVPEGFFDDFAAKMAAQLPYRPEIEEEAPVYQPKTFWQKIKPYTYMAAMFAGIWCTLQIFASITGIGALTPMDENPVIADALANDNFVMEYLYGNYDVNDVLDDMISDGTLNFDTDIHSFFASND